MGRRMGPCDEPIVEEAEKTEGVDAGDAHGAGLGGKPRGCGRGHCGGGGRGTTAMGE